MLAVLQLDSVSLPLLDRLLAEGRVPALAELMSGGIRAGLDSTGDFLPAASYPTLYSGLPPSQHGLHYVFQWAAEEQRVRFREDFASPRAVWELLAAAGRRSLVIDPYEMWRPRRVDGTVVCGWQFRNPLSLDSWSAPAPVHPALRKRFGRPQALQEIFGRTTKRYALEILETLLAAPARAAAAAEELLQQSRYDLAWITFLAPHLGGHLFWDVEELGLGERDGRSERLEQALEQLYEETARSIGRVLTALPDDADLVLVSPLGMGVNLSLVDALPEMLDRVLASSNGRPRRSTATESALWRLRAAVPTRARAAVARVLGAPAMRGVTMRMSTLGADWSQTPAFLVPSDHFGQVRLNVRGREREGIVDPADAEALGETIVEGLATFRAPDGRPAIDSVVRGTDAGPGPATQMLPDLIVRWTARPASEVSYVHSDRYGRVDRRGAGTGRSGAHTNDAWVLPVARSRRARMLDRSARLEDVAATAAALWDVEIEGTPGQPLFE